MEPNDRPIRVLHVDDAADFGDLAAAYLEREAPRLSVTSVTGGEAALERLEDRSFDCVVSDFEMPGMDGIELLEAVREDHADLPFVLFTGKGSEEVASEAISAGVTDYLQKEPGGEQFAILANRIENLVGGYRSRRASAARQRRLETLISNLPGMVYRCSNERGWPMESVVGECEALTGYDPEALERDEVSYGGDVIHPDDREAVWETVQDAIERDAPFEVTYRIVRRDGDVKWVWERGRAAGVDHGGRTVLEGFVTDVSAHRERERAIAGLHEASRALLATDTAEGIADVVANVVRDVLGMPLTTVHLLDETTGRLEPTSWTEPAEALLGTLPSFGPDEGLAWSAFESGEPQVFDDVSTVAGRLNDDTVVRSEIILPLAGHGVVLMSSDEPAAFDDTAVSLARTLAVHATTALDRIERETELARQRALLEAQQEAVIDGVLVVDDAGEIVSYNERFVELWGIPDDVVAQGDDEVVLDYATDRLEHPEAFLEKVEHLYDHPEETSRDEIELADGRVFDRYSGPLVGDDGTHFGRLWTFRDVTAREVRERRLEALQGRTQALMRTSSVEETVAIAVESAHEDLEAELSGVHLVDESGTRLEPVALTDSVEEHFEEPPVYERSADQTTPAGVVWRAFESGDPVLIEDARDTPELAEATRSRSGIIHPLGDHGVFVVSATSPDAIDETVRPLVEILAISLTAALDRIERAHQLETERDRLSALFEMVPDPITHVRFEDGSPLIVATNSAFESTFGYAEDEVVGRSVNEVIVPPDRAGEAEAIDEIVRERETVTREVRRRTAEGIGDFLFRSVPTDHETDHDEYYGIYVDVTEQKAAERQLERQNERLEEFTSVVSHDLRNPLTVAQGYLDLVEAPGEDEKVDAIEGAHDRMASLIEDLLAVARDGDRALTVEPVDVGRVVDSSWQHVATADATIEADADLTVRADETRLAQLFENLFRNAVEHGGDDVTVRVGSLESGAGFFVEDDGPGVPTSERESVFEMGYSTTASGTGFGLSIVRQVCDAHGWTVRVGEGAAGGARFEVDGVSVVDRQAPA
jgi:PAS domain S-box-containing protein